MVDFNKFKLVELTKHRNLYKNNQQAGNLITRLPAIFMAVSAISLGCANAPASAGIIRTGINVIVPKP